jgi:hypothetical protein
MRTVRTKVYKFEELSDEAKQVAIDNNRDINTDYEWWNPMFEGFTELLEKQGFYETEIYFSGFYSQGDGACFDGKVDALKFAESINEKRVARLIDAGILEGFTIEKTSFSNHYSHEKTRYVDVWREDRKNIDRVLVSMCEEIEEKRLSLSKQIYNDLYKAYEELQSDEFISGTLIVNEYEFLSNGKRF